MGSGVRRGSGVRSPRDAKGRNLREAPALPHCALPTVITLGDGRSA